MKEKQETLVRAEKRSPQRLRFQIETLEARIAPDGTGDTPVTEQPPAPPPPPP